MTKQKTDEPKTEEPKVAIVSHYRSVTLKAEHPAKMTLADLKQLLREAADKGFPDDASVSARALMGFGSLGSSIEQISISE